MYQKTLLILFMSLAPVIASASSEDNCRSILKNFVSASIEKNASIYKSLKNEWTLEEKGQFIKRVRELEFSSESIDIIIDSLNLQNDYVSPERAKNYLSYVLSLTESSRKAALFELAYLDKASAKSKHIKKFLRHELKIQEKVLARKMSPAQQARYQELYHGCRSMSPNSVNINAAKDFKNFNLSLNLGTLGASYAFYNMDKEINAEWFAKLGYDIAMTIFYSHVGSSIQTKATDTQIVKSLKSYLSGRVMGLTDVIVYDPIFNQEQEKARVRLEELKKNPEHKKEIEKLLALYNEQGLYRKYKYEIIKHLKLLPGTVSMGLKGNSIDENQVDWNNLSHQDLDRPEVQDVLLAAAMAQVYHEGKGEWFDTGDSGLDRYAFNTVFYGAQIPRSLVQNFITYRMLCMGQDNAKLSFTKAVLFNVSMSFINNQLLFGYREKAIGRQ